MRGCNLTFYFGPLSGPVLVQGRKQLECSGRSAGGGHGVWDIPLYLPYLLKVQLVKVSSFPLRHHVRLLIGWLIVCFFLVGRSVIIS